MAETVYILCALTSIAIALLLFRGYLRTRARFLLWCGLCFIGLAINNGLLFFDKVIFPDDDLFIADIGMATWRGLAALGGLSLLVIGLVLDSE